jgi:hypothetical protein
MASTCRSKDPLKNRGLRTGSGPGFLARETGIMKVGLYARVSTHDQQTLALQREAMAASAGSGRHSCGPHGVEPSMPLWSGGSIAGAGLWLISWGRFMSCTRWAWALSRCTRPWISPRPQAGRWRECWRSLPSLSVRFSASASKLALPKLGDVGDRMGDPRPSHTVPVTCDGCMPKAIVSPPLPDS